MTSLSQLYLILEPLRSAGYVTSYTYPVEFEEGNPSTTLTVTRRWASSLFLPVEEETVELDGIVSDQGQVQLRLRALHSKWERILPLTSSSRELNRIRAYWEDYRFT